MVKKLSRCVSAALNEGCSGSGADEFGRLTAAIVLRKLTLPDTILRWHRELVAKTSGHNEKRIGVDRPHASGGRGPDPPVRKGEPDLGL